MVQAAEELILGFELEETVQMTYYHRTVSEPVTVSLTPGAEDYRLPFALRQDCAGGWHLWQGEPQEEGKEPDRCRISGLYGKLCEGAAVEDNGIEFTPQEILAIYFRTCMELLKVLTQNARIHVMVTVRNLDETFSHLVTEALEQAGIDRKQIYVQDYLSSFYHYTVNQRKELWYQDVALLEYYEGAILGYVLHIDRKKRPAIAQAELVARQPMGDEVRGSMDEQEWKRERDRLFFELLKKVFERRMVSVSYLVGDYFSKSWAERSIQFLCCRRHAFQGGNLYSKGACYAAMDRAGLLPDRGILFSGRDMIRRNLGMELRIRGKETFYPLITAGINWYEAHHSCELIPDGTREICISSAPMEDGEPVMHILRLTGLPERPDRATRLRMTLYFSSPGCCHVEVEDLGFGEMYRPSGMVWRREICF